MGQILPSGSQPVPNTVIHAASSDLSDLIALVWRQRAFIKHVADALSGDVTAVKADGGDELAPTPNTLFGHIQELRRAVSSLEQQVQRLQG